MTYREDPMDNINRSTLQMFASRLSVLGGMLMDLADRLDPIRFIECKAAGMACGDCMAEIANLLDSHPNQDLDVPILDARPVIDTAEALMKGTAALMERWGFVDGEA